MWFSLTVWRRGPVERRNDTGLATLTTETVLLEAAPSETAPRVTVQIPIYNELYVSERVIEAVCALEYPRELLQIQVLDDSTDATTDIVARVVAKARAQQIDIVHVRRAERDGYKAGALRNGMLSATGEFIAIFDADFVPEPDFLVRTVPHFDDDSVAFVQGRWGHFNRDHSWLTRLQSLAIDGHFLVEQACRGVRGYWFNFNGTAGIWRATAIEDAGGWQAETLTEDLDLSYRAHLRGWRGHFV
ncbi:MAG: glycosyltransferase, partial [Actinobacteria bacterium]|nr:glycosyltransferase [Actinomycetota bacterium]